MAKAKARQQVRIIKEQRQAPVEKADTSVQLSEQEVYNAGDWITPPNDLRGLRNLVKQHHSPPVYQSVQEQYRRIWHRREVH